MTIDNMRVLIAVYETQSVTKAAERLFISQPSVSIAIKVIEKEYNQKLFERYSRHLKITPFGEQMCQYASRILALYDEMNHVAELNAVRDSLRIGAGQTIGQILLPSTVARFSKLHPGINISVKIDHVGRLREKILNNELDFAIAEAGLSDPVIVSIPLLECPYVAICSKDNPLAKKKEIVAADLAEADIIARQQGSFTRQMMDYYFDSHDIKVVPKWESSDTQAILHAVKYNFGIGFLALYHVKTINDADIVILNVSDFSGSHKQNLYYHRDKVLSPMMNEFITIFKEYNEFIVTC